VPQYMNNTKIFSGNSNRAFAVGVANSLGLPIGDADVSIFSDGEVRVEINESVRGVDCVVVQSTCAPTNDNLMELLVMIDALRRSAAKSITAVIPYYGYSRQDRRPDFTRTPVTSRLVADMLQTVGVDQVLTVDIHSGQQSGFFTIPIINISASIGFVADMWKSLEGRLEDVVVVSPDTGGVARARSVAKQLDNASLAIIDKRRPEANTAEVMNIIGDVENKVCIVVDDMIDTAGTLCKGAAALRDRGARRIVAYATHAVFSGAAPLNIANSHLDEVVVSDTIPLVGELPHKIRSVSVTGLVAETLYRIRAQKSVSEMYIGQ
jgi:ribose-phosphate pyrophosphokinase